MVKIGFAIGGHSEHTRTYVLHGVESTVQLALFVSVKISVFHKTILLGDFSTTANQALAQAHPIDTLHLTS